MGNLDDSWSHLNAARGLFDSERRLPLSPRYIGFDIEVLRLLHSGWTLWQLGYPDQGLEKAQEAVAVANAISHPPNVYIAWSYLGVLHQFRGDVDAVGTSVDNAIAACEKFGISDWLALTVCLKGWIAAARGQYQDGIARQREFLNTSMIFGTKLFEPYSLCLLAESFMSIGLLDDGFNALKKALDGAEQNEHRYFETEAHRLKGEILLRLHSSRAGDARDCFERAIQIAQKQGSRSLELRAATSLARHLRKTGRRAEARTRLASIYAWFTEGFDTKDLKDARALLDELNASALT